MKIYNCFMLFNELELLELRLATLYDHVDYFVIVESPTTWNHEYKPLHYLENKERFKKWEKKIIYIIADLPYLNWFDKLVARIADKGLHKWTLTSQGTGKWKREHAMRNQIMRGLANAAPDDIVLLDDADEIPTPEAIKRALPYAKKGEFVWFRQKMYIYYINGHIDTPWIGTRMCTVKYLKERLRGSPQYMRVPFWLEWKERFFGIKPDVRIIDNAGWHFTYLGGAQRVVLKRKTATHYEITHGRQVVKTAVQKDIEAGVYRYEGKITKIHYVPVDDTFPKYVVQNRRKYAHLIRPVRKH